jgi:signal transduction histidine kinase
MKINLGKFEITLNRNGNIRKEKEAMPVITAIREKDLKDDLERMDTVTTLEFVSHELKGVLGSTIMCAYSIRDGFLGMLNFKQRATLETIIKNLRRLELTIRDFLDISKIEGGKLKLNKTKFNIRNDVIKEVEDTFISEIYEKRIILEDNVPADIILLSDRILLLTVFNNLISNAIKYGKGGGKIILNFTRQKRLFRFSVYNDGEPLKHEEIKKLFKKFSRIENENNRKIKGTGLGLFIVKKIIDALGGDIWIEAKENGNEFIFEIEGE